ncbi:shikimate kinase [Polycyclovorans algicola]|uniref:shikimate kinase n=1 Tax=Polycyclovorans algicola TaxID=616992 RepID=UPI0004A6F1C0|nr:shikimate kinase [Polycyclovorans algicola]
MSTERLFLVGPMGAGKTTIGKRLARVRGLRFIDADHELERRLGVDIPFIFEKEGEAGFRQREHDLLVDVVQQAGVVLATGGGAVLWPANRDLLQANGTVIYLHASVRQQAARTAHSHHRPLLNTGEAPSAILSRLFEQRDPLYRQIADLVVETQGRGARALIDEIQSHLAQNVPKRVD